MPGVVRVRRLAAAVVMLPSLLEAQVAPKETRAGECVRLLRGIASLKSPLPAGAEGMRFRVMDLRRSPSAELVKRAGTRRGSDVLVVDEEALTTPSVARALLASHATLALRLETAAEEASRVLGAPVERVRVLSLLPTNARGAASVYDGLSESQAKLVAEQFLAASGKFSELRDSRVLSDTNAGRSHVSTVRSELGALDAGTLLFVVAHRDESGHLRAADGGRLKIDDLNAEAGTKKQLLVVLSCDTAHAGISRGVVTLRRLRPEETAEALAFVSQAVTDRTARSLGDVVLAFQNGLDAYSRSQRRGAARVTIEVLAAGVVVGVVFCEVVELCSEEVRSDRSPVQVREGRDRSEAIPCRPGRGYKTAGGASATIQSSGHADHRVASCSGGRVLSGVRGQPCDAEAR